MTSPDSNNPKQSQNKDNRLVLKLVGLVVGMFVFGVFVLPPMYDVICEVTGLNGKTGSNPVAEGQPKEVDQERKITIQFIADTHTGMPWEFGPVERRMEVYPGQVYQTRFKARNRSGGPITGQAIPSVSPPVASVHLKKTQCFCFEQQTLAGGEEADMPLIFYVDPELPESVKELTLSYTLYNVTERVKGEQKNNQPLASN